MQKKSTKSYIEQIREKTSALAFHDLPIMSLFTKTGFQNDTDY